MKRGTDLPSFEVVANFQVTSKGKKFGYLLRVNRGVTVEFGLRYRKTFPLIRKIRISHVQPKTTALLLKDKVSLFQLMYLLAVEFRGYTSKFRSVIQKGQSFFFFFSQDGLMWLLVLFQKCSRYHLFICINSYCIVQYPLY